MLAQKYIFERHASKLQITLRAGLNTKVYYMWEVQSKNYSRKGNVLLLTQDGDEVFVEDFYNDWNKIIHLPPNMTRAVLTFEVNTLDTMVCTTTLSLASEDLPTEWPTASPLKRTSVKRFKHQPY